MKGILKRWLGVEAVESRIADMAPPSDIELRRLVGQALMDVIAGKPDAEHYWCLPIGYGNEFEQCIARKAAGPARNAAEEAVSKKVDAEAFLDDVIDRIKRKQLEGS